MNICTFTGRTTKDIELRQTQSGKSVARFSLAVDTGYGDNKKTSFFTMTAWGKTAEAMEKYILKGTKIAVECEAQQNQYTDKNDNKVNTVDFTVRNWEFCESKGQGKAKPQTDSDGFMYIPEDTEDMLPFN